jgi:hypothetical protein
VCVVKDEAAAFYADVLECLSHGGLPFLVGGAFAYVHYSGLARETKDLDLFVTRDDVDAALSLLEARGYKTALTFPHWLGKATYNDRFVDLIFSSGNGIARVDELWFDHAAHDTIFGVPIRLCPAEEMIWSKAFVQERERFDGADVLHLIRARGPELAWDRLLMRFAEHCACSSVTSSCSGSSIRISRTRCRAGSPTSC